MIINIFVLFFQESRKEVSIMTEVEQQPPQTNGIDISEEDENNKSRPADIEAVCNFSNFFFLDKLSFSNTQKYYL